MKNKMDLSVNIAVGSGIQMALFVAPVLVFASMLMGHERPLDLHFTPMEIVAVIVSIAVLAQVAQDGESHWLEGVMLLAVYAILALAFYHLGDLAAAGAAGSLTPSRWCEALFARRYSRCNRSCCLPARFLTSVRLA